MTIARHLRKNATRAERILWRHLRDRRFANHKFRRQHPIDPFILDFYCPEAQLGIELDGGGHNRVSNQQHDAARAEFLATEGIVLLRFWNHLVIKETESVMQTIWIALEERSKRNPSP